MSKHRRLPSYKQSIKSRISLTYISIYILIGIIVLLTFVGGHVIYNVNRFASLTNRIKSDVSKTLRELTEYIEQGQNIDSKLITELGLIGRTYASTTDIFLYYQNHTLFAATVKTYDNDEYFNAREKGLLYLIMPQLVKAGGNNGIYIDQAEVSLYDDNSQPYIMLVQYSLKDVKANLTVSLQILAITLLLGLVLFSIVGMFRVNSMLAPIETITGVAKKINGENLALRIDESSAQFELYELVKTINNMMDRIQSSYNKQMRFVSDVSHELRTPVSVVSGYGNMLKRWGKDDEDILQESIEAIIKESNAMNDLIEKLLFLARHDNESLRFEFEMADVSKILQEVVKETIIVHNDFIFDLDLSKDLYAEVDPQRIKQLSRILIDNALKYSHEAKTIKVTLREKGGYVVFSVRDYGIGISKEHLPNIFDRFYRADESRTRETGGYGLGLPMASVIVIGHGGSITVKSKVDEGSEFIVSLPITQQRARDKENDAAQSA